MISLLEDLAGMLGRPVSASGRALLMDITDPEGKALARFRTAVGDISVFSDRLSEAGAVGVVPAKAVPVARQPFIIDFVENDSTDGISGNAERLERLGDERSRRTAPFDDQYDLVRQRRESERINNRQQRRGIHHDIIVLESQLRDQIHHGLRTQQISWALRDDARGDYEQAGSRVLNGHRRNVGLALQHLC